MSLLELKTDKRPPTKERMLIAFDDNGQPFIMCRRGPGIEGEDYGLSAEDLGVPGPTSVYSYGLWVYDVVPKFCEEHSEGYPTGYGNLEYDGGEWRRPTPSEWEYIKVGDMGGLFAVPWADITSQVQWEEGRKRGEGQEAD